MTDINEIVNQLMELSPPAALVIAINFVVMFARKIPGIQNWILPWLAFAIGAISYPLVADPGKVSFAVRSPVAAQVVLGFLIGGASIGTHQIFTKTLERLGMAKIEDEYDKAVSKSPDNPTSTPE